MVVNEMANELIRQQKEILLCPHCNKEVVLNAPRPLVVKAKAKTYKSRQRWTQAEIDELKQMKKTNMNLQLFAKQHGRSFETVCALMYKLGFKIEKSTAELVTINKEPRPFKTW